jgi:cyclopropane fatty-acyl-phospholipid synthase-like methyltransferase
LETTDLNVTSSFRYDQPAVLADCIIGCVRARGARTLLDIGAGDGAVAVPVSREVDRYLAVEADPSSSEKLRQAGLEVVTATFPVTLGERFDIVVSSHSIPEGGVESYAPFLAAAWEHVAPNGLLLIITFKGSDDSAIVRLSQELLGRTYRTDHRYLAMLDILRTYGTVEITKCSSHVETDEFSDVAAFFGTWFWKTDEQEARCKPILRAALDERFRVGDTYRVPTEHLVISTT